MNLQNGDVIHLLHHSKVKESGKICLEPIAKLFIFEETLGYFFTLCKIENLKRKDHSETEDQTIKKDLEKLRKVQKILKIIV